MGTCFESESIKLLQLQIFCITLTAFCTIFISRDLMLHSNSFVALITQGGKEGGGGKLSRIMPIF